MRVTEKAYAKLNLTLEVGKKRPDGYHEVRSVMTSATLCDTIQVEPLAQSGITVECDRSDVPTDDSNLAVKAAATFFTSLRELRPTELRPRGCHIRLQKQIPMEAGLGGGSSDAAAVLRALRALYAPTLSLEDLETIGARVGSDVPYCVRGGTALCQGRGEKCTPLPPIPKCWYVIVKPQEAFSTAKMYGEIDVQGARSIPTTDLLIEKLECGNLAEIAIHMSNTFQEIIPEESAVWDIQRRLLACGALNAMMSGSGSAVFGIFDSRLSAKAAYEAIQENGWQVFLAESV